MEYDEVINGRRSTRGFLNKPVSVEVLKEVIELAVRAPSSMNTQPWHFHIVTGEVLDNIRRENTKRNVDGTDHADADKTYDWNGSAWVEA